MIRYKRLGYLALNVTDVDRSAAFYRDAVGLQQIDGPDERCRYLRCSDKHHDIVLYQGDAPGLKRIAFEMESDLQFDELRRALDAHAIPWIDVPQAERDAMNVSAALRTWEPATGCALDFYTGMCSPGEPDYEATVTQIARLGHLVLRSPQFDRSLAFFTETLNFKVSDYIDRRIAFMRCFPNPYHHSVGVGNGDGKSANMNHINFMVTDVDDIGRAMWRLQKFGSAIVNGPGRHLPSGSMFLYFLDPDGITVEFSFGMEEFHEHEAPREPRTLPVEPRSFDTWLGPVDKRKAAVGSIENASPATTH
jgi:2,3-dihydroxy-p-cumate/2,3-dihydroxybenzoate 3,4-dioxygenase